jgi:hypothetical protein
MYGELMELMSKSYSPTLEYKSMHERIIIALARNLCIVKNNLYSLIKRTPRIIILFIFIPFTLEKGEVA